MITLGEADTRLDESLLLHFSAEQYHAMLDKGIIPEGSPIELLDGLLVRKNRAARGESIVTVGKRHMCALLGLEEALQGVKQGNYHLRSHGPISPGENQEPEPDLAIVQGTRLDYLLNLPGPLDIVAVMEVSDSSLHQDRTTKLAIYANGGLPIYWIVNLVDNQIEVYTNPQPGTGKYATRTDYRGREVIPWTVGDQALRVPVAEILPPI